MDNCRRERAPVADALQDVARACSIRGSDAARFLLAQRDVRGVEVARSGTGWSVDDWPDLTTSSHQQTSFSAAEAIRPVRA